jgi:hypothetical protein
MGKGLVTFQEQGSSSHCLRSQGNAADSGFEAFIRATKRLGWSPGPSIVDSTPNYAIMPVWASACIDQVYLMLFYLEPLWKSLFFMHIFVAHLICASLAKIKAKSHNCIIDRAGRLLLLDNCIPLDVSHPCEGCLFYLFSILIQVRTVIHCIIGIPLHTHTNKTLTYSS